MEKMNTITILNSTSEKNKNELRPRNQALTKILTPILQQLH